MKLGNYELIPQGYHELCLRGQLTDGYLAVVRDGRLFTDKCFSCQHRLYKEIGGNCVFFDEWGAKDGLY